MAGFGPSAAEVAAGLRIGPKIGFVPSDHLSDLRLVYSLRESDGHRDRRSLGSSYGPFVPSHRLGFPLVEVKERYAEGHEIECDAILKL